MNTRLCLVNFTKNLHETEIRPAQNTSTPNLLGIVSILQFADVMPTCLQEQATDLAISHASPSNAREIIGFFNHYNFEPRSKTQMS